MMENDALVVKEIVWAKAGPSPWWPGKISKKINQNDRLVYKINFFGDSSQYFLSYSSCYLHSHLIARFLEFNQALNKQFPSDFKLEKAKTLAKVAFQRCKTSVRTNKQEVSPSSPIPEPILLENALQTSFIEQKTPLFQIQQTNNESGLNEGLSGDINTENIFDFIESHSSFKNQSYCYTQRKEVMKLRERLKETLLQKYNLHLLSKPNSIQTKYNLKEKILNHENSLRIRQNRKLRNNSMNYIRKRCIMKIKLELEMLGKQKNQAKRDSIEIFLILQQKSNDNINLLKNLFVKMIKLLRKSEKLTQNFIQSFKEQF